MEENPKEYDILLHLRGGAGTALVKAGAIVSVKRYGLDRSELMVEIQGNMTFYVVDEPGLLSDLLSIWQACLAYDERAALEAEGAIQ